MSSTLIQQAVSSYYEEQRKPKYEPNELRLSETGDCPRKRALKALGLPVTHPIGRQALETMETGNLWEAWLVERIRSVTPDVETQVGVTAPYGAGGHIDALVWGATPADSLVIECKATSQWAKDLPDARHVLQVQAYLHFHGIHVGITRAQLVYIHRENGAVQPPIDITYNPAVGLQIQEELQDLRQDIEAGEAPGIPAEMVATKFPCSWTSRTGGGFCAYYGHCWGNGNGQG
jgi:hypothetical protein